MTHWPTISPLLCIFKISQKQLDGLIKLQSWLLWTCDFCTAHFCSLSVNNADKSMKRLLQYPHYNLSELAAFTWHSDVALGTSDGLPWSAQGHQRCCLRWLFHDFPVPRWQRPRPSTPSFPSSSHLPQPFTLPIYDCVLQQHCGTYSPAGFCGKQRVRVRPIRWGVVCVI